MSITPGWLGRSEAAAALGVSDPRAVDRLAGKGLIGVRDLPGVRARYSRADVERLARECVRPAKDPSGR